MLKKLLLNGLSVVLAGFLSIDFINEAQAQDVSGTVVTEADGIPLPGVNVVIQGTDIGTVTDAEGNYEISVPSLQETLVFSFVGYQTEEIAIDGRTNIDVVMTSLAIVGEEMVVTAFGIERDARSLTYSTQDVDTRGITEARETNVMQSLQGRVGGMQITQAATGVGASTRVVLRGNRSISGDSQPLYVLDGVPIRGNPQDLNPDDIESIDVLKGPNAAALYGSAAQNGAIVITTRRGEAGVVDVSFSNNLTFSQANLLTEYQNEYGQGSGGEYSPGSEFSWGPRMDGSQVQHWTVDPDNELYGQTYAFEPQPNNVEDVFQTGVNNATNLRASIGGERTQTVFSYTYTNAEGIVPNNAMERHNMTVRVSSELTEGLNLDSRLTYMRRNLENSLSTGESFSNPIRNTYRMPRNIRTQDILQFEYTNLDGQNRQHYWNPGSNGGNNPYWVLNRNLNEQTRERTIAMASLNYSLNESVDMMVRASYDGLNTSGNWRFWNDSYIIADQGQYSVNRGFSLEWNGEFLLTYAEDLTPEWSVEANIGANYKQLRNNTISANTGPGLEVENFFTLSNTLNVSASENIGSPMDVASVYAFGQLGWRDAIYLDVTARNDWSSTLPLENNSYFYPSVGLTTVISDLIDMPEAVSLARIRASYAEVGNSAPAFMLNRTASFGAGGTGGFLQLSGTLPAEDLRPERTESYEAGLDIRFFEGRLGLDATVYQTNTTDQLFTVALPVGSGASQFFTNGGDIQNRGVEFILRSTPIQTLNFAWDFNVNFGLNRNLVVAIDDERPTLSIGSDFLRVVRVEEGRPFGEVYSRGYVRDNDGNVIVGSNGVPEITEGRSVLVANFNPDFTGGITSELSFRNWNASFVIDHRQGGSIASMSNAVAFADGVTKQTLQGREGGLIFGENFMEHESAVMQTGVDDQGNPIYGPNTLETDAESFWRQVGGRNTPAGEVFQDSATNTRVRELTIGYNLPQSILANMPVSNIRVSLVGRNLFFIYRSSDNLDPDLMIGTFPAAEGFESFAPPTTRTFGVNLNIDF